MRGDGAYLIDSRGHRFMGDYDSRLELAPRDVVSQSIVSQMEKTQSPCVLSIDEAFGSDARPE